MVTILKVARFVGEDATLEVRQCADRPCIHLVMESHTPPAAPDRYEMTLEEHEWRTLTSVNYAFLSEMSRELLPPNGVSEALLFIDEVTELEVAEGQGDEVRFTMRGANTPEDLASSVSIVLDREQWCYLHDLDYLDEVTREPVSAAEPPPAPAPPVTSDESVH